MRPPIRLAYRLGWLLFGLAGFFAPDWTSERFADSMLSAWPERPAPGDAPGDVTGEA